MATSKIDLSAGMIPKKPMHPAGEVTGWDEKTSLPIVRRKEQPSVKSAETPEPQAKPLAKASEPAEKQEPAKEGPEPKPELAKGAPVTVNGKSGKVVFVHQSMGIARVRMDLDGKAVTVRQSALQVQPHTTVKEHIRKIPQPVK